MRRALCVAFSRLMSTSTHSDAHLPSPPHKVLVANRGEVAIRVARALQLLRIPSVAVHAVDDSDSLHVQRCDVSHALGGTGTAAYLDADDLLRAALAHGCTALHPGYGMLSESHKFAAAVEAAGLVWIGPSPAVLAQFGDKIAASARARSLGIPVPASSGALPCSSLCFFSASTLYSFLYALTHVLVPPFASTAILTSPSHALAIFDSLCSSKHSAIMLKAVFGGGGRGMRVVRERCQVIQPKHLYLNQMRGL
jgi:acetyl/propionyl-CoA carboxylase alpha subunit